MVSDSLSNLSTYYSLDEELRKLSSYDGEVLPSFYGFRREKDRSVIFTVERGTAIASTSWRETPESMEPISALRVATGSFVLFLPGEPFIVKAEDENADITMRILGGRDAS